MGKINKTMINKNCQEVLRKILSQLKNHKINWMVIGGANLALQGIPTEIHDIDILTDKNGAYKIEKIFKEYITKKISYSSTDKIRSYFGVLKIMGVRVEIMGNVKKYINNKWETKSIDLDASKKTIKFQNMKLPVFSLECELTEYKKMKRYKKAKIIENKIKKYGK